MYLTEIAPVNVRGAMGVVHQFALTCGIFVSQIVGLKQLLGKKLATRSGEILHVVANVFHTNKRTNSKDYNRNYPFWDQLHNTMYPVVLKSII